ncbi:hypothetical protein IA539_13085 [Gordonia sp. zg691]|uniref:Uncharacterized protein n=1 Tax=Gordonia jinghuaiqii TaxID=2758710 RepID=A0A7D7R4R0_9ACTN|nr:hypothetical protein [Gordonia jinghuaiqii]MBD0862142.1 hypothetical protein [Gordonia jinghuaiqii]MCR5978634.1 hypothetical protein [Gordonia jinghuaiqii]QMT02952.1 hypothetical protein H1R19_07480 [Gordonia jinghuaiqii]
MVDAVWQARGRGVVVQLFDEGGLGSPAERADQNGDETVTALHDAIVEQLDATTAGTVTVRVQPPGRALLAVITSTAGDTVDRVEFTRG